ncbi:hypothetical protein [Streptomyces sp. PA5.6]|uniref:hypothetical protein n=1 Tax=Streptomyces sp. PA5.6 TaxID=3035651 RepID=UPI00390499C6
MDGFHRASWASAAMQWGADLIDEYRDLQDHGPDYVTRKRQHCWEQARRCSPYSPRRRTLAYAVYVLGPCMFLMGLLAALAGGTEHGTALRVLMMIGIYAWLLSIPLYLVIALQTGRELARAAQLTLADDPLPRSRTAEEYAVRSMSQPLNAAWGSFGALVTGLLPLPGLHIRMYQQSVYAALYRGVDVSCLRGTP